MDHKQILSAALAVLCREMLQSPVAFELLPRKFTIRALQNLYSAVLGIEIDNRNFRKKILASGFLTPTAEREQGVATSRRNIIPLIKTPTKRRSRRS